MVLHLVGFGVRRIFLSINYLGQMIEEHFGDGSRFGCVIEYLREDKPLGTGGALGLLEQRPTAPMLVVNGDVVTQANFGAMIDAHSVRHEAQPETMITVATRRYFHSIPFGCVRAEGDRIVDIEEKPTISQLINAGMYVVSPQVLDHIPRDVEFMMPTLIDGSLSRGEVVKSFEVAEDWIDVGQREQLRQARGEMP